MINIQKNESIFIMDHISCVICQKPLLHDPNGVYHHCQNKSTYPSQYHVEIWSKRDETDYVINYLDYVLSGSFRRNLILWKKIYKNGILMTHHNIYTMPYVPYGSEALILAKRITKLESFL